MFTSRTSTSSGGGKGSGGILSTRAAVIASASTTSSQRSSSIIRSTGTAPSLSTRSTPRINPDHEGSTVTTRCAPTSAASRDSRRTTNASVELHPAGTSIDIEKGGSVD